MATKVNFGGQQVVLPNTYARIVSGVENPPSALETGEVLVIDTGGNATWGGGAGVDGELSQGLDSFYRFTSLKSAQNHVMGGKYYKYLQQMFFPQTQVDGVPAVTFVKCATTTAPTISKTFDTFSFDAKCKFEGIAGNGVATGEQLAVWEFRVDAVGDTGDTHTITIDGNTIGTYTVPAVPLDPANTALALAQNVTVTASGYTVKSLYGSIIRIEAPVGSGSTSNSLTFSYDVTGTALGTASLTRLGISALLLEKGFAMKVLEAKNDPTKVEAFFYKSSFTGINPNDEIPYDEISLEDSRPILVAKSPAVATLQQLISWAKKDRDFNKYFEVDDQTGGGDENLVGDGEDVWVLASGGTEVYDLNLMDQLLSYVNDTNAEFIITTEDFSNALSPFAQKVINYVNNESRFIRQFFVSGGNNANEFAGSISIAEELNSDVISLVHGAMYLSSQASPSNMRYWSSEAKKWQLLGRLAGLQPQNSLTRKSIKIAKEVHTLTDDEKVQALDAGILVSHYNTDRTQFTVLQGVNTLQENEFLFNENGTTFSIQVKRIDAAINKRLVIESNKKLLGAEGGANKNNLSTVVISEFTKSQLNFVTATETQDNLILGFRNIEVSIDQDNFFVDYQFSPNSEITKGFFTGTRVVF
jgi:hypothetical protein